MDAQINGLGHNTKSPKKRVLFVITQSEFGGAQRFLDILVSRLDKDGFELEVALGSTGTKDFLEESLIKGGINVRRVNNLARNPSPFKDLKAVFELRQLYKQTRPDIIFLLSSKAGFIGSLAARFKIQDSKFKIIYRIGGWTFNDPWPTWKKKLWIFLEKLSARWKDVIIVNNKHDFDQAKQLGIKPRQNLVLIHNGLDVYRTEFLPSQEARLKLFEKASRQAGRIFQTDIIVGTIANFYLTKGLKYLIETAEYFKNRDDVAFFIIGDGDERTELENLISEKGLQKKVLLLGQTPDANKLLNAFDIFILPSVKEGFPWVVLEAMAAKLPVIATRVGAIPEIIEDGKNGMLVEPAKPEQIAGRIQELMNNEHLRQELGIQAHQTVLFKFPLEKMIEEIKELF